MAQMGHPKGLCDVCKKLAELGMPCHPISCQCRCHWRTKKAHENAMKQKGFTIDDVNSRIASQIKAGAGIF